MFLDTLNGSYDKNTIPTNKVVVVICSVNPCLEGKTGIIMLLHLAISRPTATPARALEVPFKRLAICKHYSVRPRQGRSDSH